jgi:hypothetical protein
MLEFVTWTLNILQARNKILIWHFKILNCSYL